MNALNRLLCMLVLALAGCASPPPDRPTSGNDFPTSERVIFVQSCVRDHPGPHFEMINKCSCALDAMASDVRYDDYVSMTTIINALTIGGERGGELRDNETIKPQVKRYRELEAKALQACFITK